ncbi:MAG TPA: S9 family peptidase [Chromatiaceae bacterium]|jgi:dipeptidyl aminopeptidase/acylaminoacyl peptidase|nr:S9 family peptidase [Chromatiaceae bacterium]
MSRYTLPFGSWPSPFSSDAVVAAATGLGQVVTDLNSIYWLENRPQEQGRSVIMCADSDGAITVVTPASFNVRSRVHEYGGGAFTVKDGHVYFVNDADQRIYTQRPDGVPTALTPEQPGARYCDMVIDRRRNTLICVQEDHRDDQREAINRLVSIALGQTHEPCIESGSGSVSVLMEGADFYASPALGHDGQALAWLEWDHPDMPWDATRLMLATRSHAGELGSVSHLCGGDNESIFQPRWSPDNELYFVSDRSGWWNLHRWRDGVINPVLEMDAEFGQPQWVFSRSTYAFLDSTHVATAYCQRGLWQLGILDTVSAQLTAIDTPYTEINDLQVLDNQIVFHGGAPDRAAGIVNIVPGQSPTLLNQKQPDQIDASWYAVAKPIAFPTTAGDQAHALYYAPTNPDCQADNAERPPLIVRVHGGPTAGASSALDLRTQFWTSRGFAVCDVNYRGSTGYGRAYRQRLNGQWGVYDVADCECAARYLIDSGAVDPERTIIRGSSAGGYSVLSALTFGDTFKAGASLYGISNLETLAQDTHKFESRYLDRLVGPFPADRETYYQRSPIHFVDKMSAATIFFQGLEDKVVPPEQAEKMVDALKQRGAPVAYLTFAHEQHGFRQADSIKRALEAELYFYATLFGFAPADELEPIAIDNL